MLALLIQHFQADQVDEVVVPGSPLRERSASHRYLLAFQYQCLLARLDAAELRHDRRAMDPGFSDLVGPLADPPLLCRREGRRHAAAGPYLDPSAHAVGPGDAAHRHQSVMRFMQRPSSQTASRGAWPSARVARRVPASASRARDSRAGPRGLPGPWGRKNRGARGICPRPRGASPPPRSGRMGAYWRRRAAVESPPSEFAPEPRKGADYTGKNRPSGGAYLGQFQCRGSAKIKKGGIDVSGATRDRGRHSAIAQRRRSSAAPAAGGDPRNVSPPGVFYGGKRRRPGPPASPRPPCDDPFAGAQT